MSSSLPAVLTYLSPALDPYHPYILPLFTLLITSPFLYKSLRNLILSLLTSVVTTQLSKQTNGSKVTIGILYVNIFSGLFEARDIIIHTPHRVKYKWTSPLISRIGYMKVTFSTLSFIPDLPYLPMKRWLGYSVKEVYTVVVEDVQVFVEKKLGVVNYVMLDNSLDFSEVDVDGDVDESLLSDKADAGDGDEGEDKFHSVGDGEGGLNDEIPSSSYNSPDRGRGSEAQGPASSSSFPPSADKDNFSCLTSSGDQPERPKSAMSIRAETKANSIMNSFVSLVKSGYNKPPQSTLSLSPQQQQQQKQQKASSPNAQNVNTITKKLLTGLTSMYTDYASGKPLDEIAKESYKVASKLTENMTNFKDEINNKITSITSSASGGIKVKKGYVKGKESVDLFRVGVIVVRGVRVFVSRDMLSSDGSEDQGMNSPTLTSPSPNKSNSPKSKNTKIWHKPIHLTELIISSSSLSCPTSIKDPLTNLPRIGLHVQEIKDAVVKTVKVELAKSGANRRVLLGMSVQSALGVWGERGKGKSQ